MSVRTGFVAALCLLAIASPGAAAPDPPLASAVLEELNYARGHPHEYAERLRTYRSYFRGKIVREPGNAMSRETAEGVAAVDEAIAFLDRQAALEPVTWSDLLALAAGDHVAEQGPKGSVGHLSPDGGDAGARVAKRGGGSFVAEVIAYGPATPADVVRQLIVDDDVPDRSHRRIVFTDTLRFAGAACGVHLTFRTMCVIDLGEYPDGS